MIQQRLQCHGGLGRVCQIMNLGDVVHLGELEGDAEAAEERGHEGAGAGERRDLDGGRPGVIPRRRRELLERLRDLPQRLVAVAAAAAAAELRHRLEPETLSFG